MNFLSGSVAVPIVSALAGAVFAIAVIILVRSSRPTRALLPAVGAAVLIVALGAGYLRSDHRPALVAAVPTQDLSQRRLLDERRAELASRVAEPASPLACLNGLPGEAVENACAHAVFGTPQSVAAAIAYATAELNLLSDSLAYARRFDPSYADRVADLRRAAENDAYGVFAQVLAVRDGCTADQCATFALLHNVDTLKAHLRDRAYEAHVTASSGQWAAPSRSAVAASAPALPPMAASPAASMAAVTSAVTEAAKAVTTAEAPATATTASAVPTPAPRPPNTALAATHGVVPPIDSVLPNLDYPSSKSIPAVSIMAPEPAAKPAADAKKNASAAGKSTPHNPQAQQ